MPKKILRNTVIFTVLILSLVTIFFVRLISEEVKALTEYREKTLSHLAFSSKTAVAPEFNDRFERCDRMDRYDYFTATQPGDLSEDELVEAIDVGEECGSYFPDKRNFSFEKMREFSDKMRKILNSSLFGSIEKSKKEEFLNTWNSLEVNLETQAFIFKELSRIQTDYWKVELSLRKGELSSDKREKEFGVLNDEARSNIEMMSKAQDELRELKEKEQRVWESLIK